MCLNFFVGFNQNGERLFENMSKKNSKNIHRIRHIAPQTNIELLYFFLFQSNSEKLFSNNQLALLVFYFLCGVLSIFVCFVLFLFSPLPETELPFECCFWLLLFSFFFFLEKFSNNNTQPPSIKKNCFTFYFWSSNRRNFRKIRTPNAQAALFCDLLFWFLNPNLGSEKFSNHREPMILLFVFSTNTKQRETFQRQNRHRRRASRNNHLFLLFWFLLKTQRELFQAILKYGFFVCEIRFFFVPQNKKKRVKKVTTKATTEERPE